MGFYEVLLAQGVGNKNAFLSEMQLRLKDNLCKIGRVCLLILVGQDLIVCFHLLIINCICNK